MSRLAMKTKIPGTELRLGDLTVLIRDYFEEPDVGLPNPLAGFGFGYAASTPTLEVVLEGLDILGDVRRVDERLLRQAKWFALTGGQLSERNGRRLHFIGLRSAVYLAEMYARVQAGEWAVVWDDEADMDCDDYLRDEIADPNTSDEDRARARNQMENTRWQWASIRASYGSGILASLGCIGNADNAYVLQVNSDLAGEALDTLKITPGKMWVWSESKALIILATNRDW